jgi:hypothetical protein
MKTVLALLLVTAWIYASYADYPGSIRLNAIELWEETNPPKRTAPFL